jgi:ribosome-associated protein
MDSYQLRKSIASVSSFTFSRSGGPGGQNVNKVNSKAELRVDLRLLEGISAEERAILLEKLGGRLAGGYELVVHAQDTRSQLLNRDLALERAIGVIERALHRQAPRRPTKPTRASKERRLEGKKRHSAHKSGRKSPPED